MVASMNEFSGFNTAIAHDWLPLVGGAEKVIGEMVNVLPNSEIFTIFDFLTESEKASLFGTRRINTSRLNSLPLVKKYYRSLILQSIRSIEKFNLSEYDIVVSSSSVLAKGVLTQTDQPHIAYIHSPPRYAWDLCHQYIDQLEGPLVSIKKAIAQETMHRLRIWDLRTIHSIDCLVANSTYVQRRISKLYKRDSIVIHPPVPINAANLADSDDGYYLTGSRLVSYKRTELVVEAFSQLPNKKLVVVGDGPEFNNIKSIAGRNVEMVGYTTDRELIGYFQGAKAFITAGLEDFGIMSVEAQLCGTPVISYGYGGAVDAINPRQSTLKPSGVFFMKQTVESLLDAIKEFEKDISLFHPENCFRSGKRFSPENFRTKFKHLLNTGIEDGFDQIDKSKFRKAVSESV